MYFRGWAMGARQLICRSLQFRRSDRLVYPIISSLPVSDIVVVVLLVLLAAKHSELDAGTRSQDSGQMPPVQAPSDVKNRSNAAAPSVYLPTLSIYLASASVRHRLSLCFCLRLPNNPAAARLSSTTDASSSSFGAYQRRHL